MPGYEGQSWRQRSTKWRQLFRRHTSVLLEDSGKDSAALRIDLGKSGTFQHRPMSCLCGGELCRGFDSFRILLNPVECVPKPLFSQPLK